MKTLKLLLIALSVVSLFATAPQGLTLGGRAILSIDRGCGSTYYPYEVYKIIYEVRVKTKTPMSVVASLEIKMPDGTTDVLFSNVTINPNAEYYAYGIISPQLGKRKMILEWSCEELEDDGKEECEYEVISGTGGEETTLRIDSNVSNFQVWWDGVYSHTTPSNYTYLTNVPSGTHTVTLKKSGCTDASKTITIIPGVANTVTINMSCGPGGGESETPDMDGDGVPDTQDRCYNPECNLVDADGCPIDSDGDEVNECEDRCPTESGTITNDGCPAGDRDNDGVTDDQDGCYNPGCTIVDSQGCPKDSDDDGLNDCEDACPSQYGERRNDGCPEEDSDGDGVVDDEDQCYDPGCNLVDSRGCPLDSDGDGVDDCEDNCPNQAGSLSSNGCPEEQESGGFCLGTLLIALFAFAGTLLIIKQKNRRKTFESMLLSEKSS